MDSLVGATLDRYQVAALIAEGGMGRVYRGYDPQLDRSVAIKVMHSLYARQEEFQERFLLEARAAARLDHPGIVKVHDSGCANGILYLVMELIPSDNLRVMLNRMRQSNQWIPMDEAAHLVRQVCLAIDYAHRRGVLYRDVKPDNIMIKDEPSEGLPFHPVLTDLGLARLLEGMPITQDGESLGTPAYMSPEQASGRSIDARSDIYSLGILLYELVVGRLPFEIKSLAEAIRCHTKEPPPSPRFLRPDLSADLERVILQAIQKEPDRRYQDGSSMAAAILEAAPLKAQEVRSQAVQPAPGGGAVSLLTQYRPAPIEAIGPTLVKAFPGTPADLAYDRIQVMSHGQTIRTVSVKGTTLTIGRGDDNDLVLDDQSVSKHHARIDFDGQEYRVVDLKSTNGTFQDGARLLPGIPVVWAVGKTVRIGEHWLRLERSSRPYERFQEKKEEEAGMVTQVQLVTGTGYLAVLLEEANLRVEPGSHVAARLTLSNHGGTLENLQLTVEGIPPAWLAAPPPPVILKPGEQQQLELSIAPPRLASTKPGAYPLTIRAASREVPGKPGEAHATLHVAPFTQYTARLNPDRMCGSHEASLAVIVQNQGSTRLSVRLETVPGTDRSSSSTEATQVMETGRGPAEACLMVVEPHEFTVPPGEERQAQLRLSAPLPPRSKMLPFTVTVIPLDSGAQAVRLAGLFEQSHHPVIQERPKGVPPIHLPAVTEGRGIWKDGSTVEEETRHAASAKPAFSWVVMLFVWISASSIANWLTWNFFCGECLREWAFSINLAGFVADEAPWMLSITLAGALLGAGLWVALRIAEPSLPFGQIVLISLGWAVAQFVFILGIVVLPWHLRPYFLWGAMRGLIGGLATTWVLQAAKTPLRFMQSVSIAIAWTVGAWLDHAIAGGGITWNLGGPAGILTVIIGGSWTLYQVQQSQKRSS